MLTSIALGIPIFTVLILIHFQLGSIACAIIVSFVLLKRIVSKVSLLYILRIATISLVVINSLLYFVGHANFFVNVRDL